MSHSCSTVRVTRTLDTPLGVESAAPAAAGILLLQPGTVPEQPQYPRRERVCSVGFSEQGGYPSSVRRSGVRLSGVWLSGVWLSGVWLSGVQLSGVWLSGIRLSGVWLSCVWLSGVCHVVSHQPQALDDVQRIRPSGINVDPSDVDSRGFRNVDQVPRFQNGMPVG